MAYLTSYDSRQLRNVLGTFTTGVTIVTTRDPQGFFHGVTANSFSSVSLEPPLVLWSQALTSRSFAAFRDSEHFAVNILADDQIALSNHFARSQENKFETIPFTEGLGGAPVLEGTVAHFECVKVAAYPAGDHVIYVGRVERVSHSGRRPLAFAHGRYMVPYAHDLGPLSTQSSSAPVAGLEAVRMASEALPAIQRATGGHTLCLAVWGNHGATAIRWERGAHPISEQLRPGLVMSITRTATGRAFVAFLQSEITRSFVDEDLRLFRVADEDENQQRLSFQQEVDATRRTGLARIVNLEPSPVTHVTLNAFSAPVFDGDGNMIMALSLSSEVGVLAPEREGAVPAALAAAARELSARIASVEAAAAGMVANRADASADRSGETRGGE
jgi:flavin reductase (DIM6/NTAB) family NADH-FMN oxidoreductase RutF/DNA-binding IclR family transcriptional regulator